MDRRASERERQRAKEIAAAVLDGRTTVLEAVRELYLRKNGLKVPLQDQPFQVCAILLENSGKDRHAERHQIENALKAFSMLEGEVQHWKS